MWKFCAFLWLIEFVTYDDMLLNVVLSIWYGHYVSCFQFCPYLPLLFASSVSSACEWYGTVMQYDILFQDFLLRSVCVGRVELYNKVAHQKLNVHRMCQAGSRKVYQWSLKGHNHYTQWAVDWWSLAQSGLYFLYHMKTVALSHTLLCTSISWQVFRLMAAFWIEPKPYWGLE